MERRIVDHALAVRLERAEGAANARFVEARARMAPDRGAAWHDIHGIWAMFDYVEFPTAEGGERFGLKGYGHYIE